MPSLYHGVSILHISYVIDACAIPSVMPSLSLTVMMYYAPEKNPTPSSASTFRLIWILFLYSVVKVFVMELRDYVVFSVVQMIMQFERVG
jgi:hypothetical protein